eukprot:gene11835-5165_t
MFSPGTVVTTSSMTFLFLYLMYNLLLFIYQPPNITVLSPPRSFEILDAKNDKFFYFMQVSDIHLSWKKNYRKHNFEEVLQQMKNIFKPEFVLMTGDVSDAYWQMFWVHQVEKEFKDYYTTMQKYNETFNESNWFDVRGNHDNYNGGNFRSMDNFFNKYSYHGKKLAFNHTMSFVHKKSFGNYKFIGFEATPPSTSVMPHNFLGRVNQTVSNSIEELILNEKENMNHTILFGHYPLSVIHSTAQKSLFHTFKEHKVLAYLSGHLHTVIGFFAYLKAKIPNSHLELEVADFKQTQKLRLLAFDHDIFSFKDFYFNQFPVILVTNPKEAKYLSENEPTYKIGNSTHIRMLIFSEGRINKIQVFIDQIELKEQINFIGNNMFVMAWDVSKYSKGIHWIKVIAEDSKENKNFVEYQFSLDGSVPQLTMTEISGHFVLRTDWTLILRIIFCLLFGGMTIWLICCKIWVMYWVYYKDIPIDELTSSRENLIISWINRFLLLSYTNILYFYLLGYGIVIALNQWNLFVFGVLFMLHTIYPLIFYFAISCDTKFGDKKLFFIHISMFVYCFVRLIDCLWHISKYKDFPFGLWPFSSFEFFLINSIIILLKISILLYQKGIKLFHLGNKIKNEKDVE